MKQHTVTLTERELRMILTWYDTAKDARRLMGFQTMPSYDSPGRNDALYDRLRKL